MDHAKHETSYDAAIEALRAARREQGLSQVEMGNRLGRRQQFVSKYETGERRLDVIEYIDAANVLGLDWVGVLKASIRAGDGQR